MCVHSSVYTYASLLCQLRGPGHYDTSLAANTAITCTLVSNAILKENQGPLEKWLTKTGTENMQISLNHLVVP